jgi:hypothetical protein
VLFITIAIEAIVIHFRKDGCSSKSQDALFQEGVEPPDHPPNNATFRHSVIYLDNQKRNFVFEVQHTARSYPVSAAMGADGRNRSPVCLSNGRNALENTDPLKDQRRYFPNH